jgi:hypothetical protein
MYRMVCLAFNDALSIRGLREHVKIEKLMGSIWNFAPKHSLVIVTANSPYEPGQRIDVEILDTEHGGNVYLSKKVSHLPLSIASCKFEV